jgi:hypothetical protein
MKTTLRVGHCDNPLTLTEHLFPSPFFMKWHGGVDACVRRIPNMSALELQFQLFEEVPATSKPLVNYVQQVRSLGLELTAHAPFLKDLNKPGEKPQPFYDDYVWPVVPKSFKPTNNIGHVPGIRQAPLTTYKRLISILGELKIPCITCHVTRPGVILSASEWREFLAFAAELQKIGDLADNRKQDRRVTVCIETGGILDKHITSAIDSGFAINFDAAHYYLDSVNQGATPARANKLCVKAYERFHESVPVMHFSQPTVDRDAHLGLLDKDGALTCNDDIIALGRDLGATQFYILETAPHKASVDHIANILRKKR